MASLSVSTVGGEASMKAWTRATSPGAIKPPPRSRANRWAQRVEGVDPCSASKLDVGIVVPGNEPSRSDEAKFQRPYASDPHASSVSG